MVDSGSFEYQVCFQRFAEGVDTAEYCIEHCVEILGRPWMQMYTMACERVVNNRVDLARVYYTIALQLGITQT